MGEHVVWSQTGGGSQLLPNGLLPNAGPLIESLDSERWIKAEERTAELIACIQPNQPSEERRNAVADYVQRLIMKCFPCQVFTFGSVPLKTYLPDGDIDLTAFSNNPNLRDSWATEVRDMLDSEEKNENAEFHVKEVQYIQAEVKIIKCLVENIVVDISFDQLGGLCTLCFLEEVDNLINQNHLFKRSIILIKAWCYYESRILGAHHGLISTYALETLVLYIFHVFNNSFAGPLEVLYRFLEFFSNFDWENFCVSLWGPVPISSLPNVTAEPPRKDGGELLLNKVFLDACSSVYAVLPSGQDNQGQPFLSKHFNVIDPLRVSNNLGRSVSKGNFFRIRSAFAFGAKRLARLLNCPKENLVAEVNQFFTNTWDRHGSGIRPDAPGTDSCLLKSSTPDSQLTTDGQTSISIDTKSNESLSREIGQSNLKSNHLFKDIQRTPFARTQSSPELTDKYKDVSSQGRLNRAHESGKNVASPDSNYRDRRKNVETELPTHAGRISGNGPSSGHQAPPRQRVDVSVDSNIYQCDSGLLSTSEEMHQEEQDLVNMMASSTLHGFNGQVHMPMNLASGHLPFPISPSFLASMGYSQRNMAGMFPTKIPLIDHAFPGMQFPQLTHYFSGIGVPSNCDDSIDPGNGNFSSGEMNSIDAEHELWLEPDVSSGGGFKPDPSDNKLRSSSAGLNYIPPPRRVGGTGGLVRSQQKPNKEKRLPSGDEENQGTDDYSDERTTSSRFTSVAHSNSQRSQTSSENSWDERSTVQKSTMDSSGASSLTFYPTGPPVPFLTMLPFYNVPSETRPSGASTSHLGAEKSVESSRGSVDELKSDILNSDFASHWQNLQIGRLCQSPRQHGPTAYPSPMMVPPIYLQGRVPWDGPGRPTSNMNLITQLMSYGPRLVPVAPLQSVSSRPNAYQRYGDDMPRYRSGTGTYLPNPKVSPRDRNSSGLRRGNFNYDRSENHVDKEGNWNNNSKSRSSGRNLNRNQTDKSSTRSNRFVATEPRPADWSTSSFRHDSFPTYQTTQNGPLGPTTGQSGPGNVVYGVYPGEVSPNGSTVPSLVMVYPYDHNAGYGSPTEPLEFGSVGFDGVNEQFQLTEGSRGRGTLEEYRLYGGSVHRSSPDQPSSPHHPR